MWIVVFCSFRIWLYPRLLLVENKFKKNIWKNHFFIKISLWFFSFFFEKLANEIGFIKMNQTKKVDLKVLFLGDDNIGKTSIEQVRNSFLSLFLLSLEIIHINAWQVWLLLMMQNHTFRIKNLQLEQILHRQCFFFLIN